MDLNLMTQPEDTLDMSLEKILKYIEEKRYFKAKDELLKYNEADIAELFEELLEDSDIIESTVVIYRLLPKAVSVEVFAYLPSDDQLKIIDGITDKELNYIVQELDFDDKIDILEELPATIVNRILEQAPKEERKLINTFLNYPDDCAGSLMTPYYISLQREWTVGEALAYIKHEASEAEFLHTCYVKDGGRKLQGIVTLSQLVITDDNEKIANIMVTDYVWLNVYDDQEEVSEAFKKYDLIAMPVVDKEHRLVGIITVDDILDVIEDETTEDIEFMAGIIDLEQSDKEYLDKSVLQHVKARLPWLLMMMVALMLTGAIISGFEEVLSQVIVLVAYMPLLMGMGGNTGSQASTLIVRGLALNELELEDTLKVLWKEFRISFCVGAVLSMFNFAKIMLIDGESASIAATVCISLIMIVAFAKCLGGMVPMLAKLIKADLRSDGT